MTKQETFDTVARHLLTQNAKSEDNGGCRMLDACGRKCAIGCLIPEGRYLPEMEWWGEYSALDVLVCKELGHDRDLLEDLRKVHDWRTVLDWPEYLRAVAHDHDLSPAVLDEVTP